MTNEFPVRVQRAIDSIRRKSSATPRIGIILGSGLSSLAARFGGEAISFKDIEGFPAPTVSGHAGMLYVGADIVVMAGRFHYYEGHSLDTVCLPTAVMAGLGVKTIILTNASGGIHYSYRPGDLVMLSDHINMQGVNPLIGPHLEGFGPRFCDMSAVYTPALRAIARTIDPQLKEGVYLAVSGPCYESPAEIRAYRTMGADLVGMSTVPEAIMARSLGLDIMGISVVTNLASGISPTPLDHKEVMEMGKRAESRLSVLLTSLTEKILAG